MPLALNNNRGGDYSGRMKIEVLVPYCEFSLTCGEPARGPTATTR